ncbi:hypothetical protein [Streptacidiphilus melanogenes]|uniref:hypothetical protein n=1 Tax=Streptacidiphilus melanogenes TaxID=411235 RepID=UPI0005A74FFE|nr:hypothetical protein [Streptacidiphilus melanogenes]
MSKTGRRAGIVAVVVVTSVAAAVVGLWWKPWQSMSLPQNACWGILNESDVRPLVGADGTVSEARDRASIADGLKDSAGTPSGCGIEWNGSPVLTSMVFPGNDLSVQQQRAGLIEGTQPINLGTGIVLFRGWSGAVISFLCDGLKDGNNHGFVSVRAGSAHGPITGAVRDDYANIALKLAKAASAQGSCANKPAFPASVPSLGTATG